MVLRLTKKEEEDVKVLRLIKKEEEDGSCPQCGGNAWVLNRDPNHSGQLLDVCGVCGFTERSQVQPGRRKD